MRRQHLLSKRCSIPAAFVLLSIALSACAAASDGPLDSSQQSASTTANSANPSVVDVSTSGAPVNDDSASLPSLVASPDSTDLPFDPSDAGTASGTQPGSWGCRELAVSVDAVLGLGWTSSDLPLAFAPDAIGGCTFTGSSSAFIVEVYETNDLHSSAWRLVAPGSDASRADGLVESAADEAYQFEWASNPAILLRRGTIELVLTSSVTAPAADQMLLVGQAMLDGVPSGDGATRWTLNEREVADLEAVIGMDLPDLFGDQPPVPLPPGALNSSWTCFSSSRKSGGDYDGYLCLEQLTPSESDRYCDTLVDVGFRENPYVATLVVADPEGFDPYCHAGSADWYVLVGEVAGDYRSVVVVRTPEFVAATQPGPEDTSGDELPVGDNIDPATGCLVLEDPDTFDPYLVDPVTGEPC